MYIPCVVSVDHEDIDVLRGEVLFGVLEGGEGDGAAWVERARLRDEVLEVGACAG